MNQLRDILGILAFRNRALQALAGRQAFLPGVILLAAGFLIFSAVRNAVYAALPDFAGRGGTLDLVVQLIRALVFFLLIYVPLIVLLSHAIAGRTRDFKMAFRQRYRPYASALVPLWGMLFLIDAALQYAAPQFLVAGVVAITVGMLVLLVLLPVYTIWAIKHIGSLNIFQAVAVFALSSLAIVIYYPLTAFLP